jgi:hypothetical protein
MKIYLHGKVDGKKWQLVTPFKHLCEFYASDGDCAMHGSHGWKGGLILGKGCWDQCNDNKPFFEKIVFDKIRKCDTLIAFLSSNDSYGSIAEIAFASTIGKTCHMIVEEEQTDIDKLWGHCPLHDAYWFIGTFPRIRVHHVVNYQEATDRLIHILDSIGIRANSYVYFIEALGSNEIKIGSSATPERRVPGLQTGNGSELKLLGTMRGNKDFEYVLHRRFDHLRLNRDLEWFRATEELRNFIAKNCDA